MAAVKKSMQKPSTFLRLLLFKALPPVFSSRGFLSGLPPEKKRGSYRPPFPAESAGKTSAQKQMNLAAPVLNVFLNKVEISPLIHLDNHIGGAAVRLTGEADRAGV